LNNILRIVTEFPKEDLFGDITDGGVRVYVNYYRDGYQYNFAQVSSFCKTQSIKCPIIKKQIYTIDVELFIPTMDTIDNTHMFPETVIFFYIFTYFGQNYFFDAYIFFFVFVEGNQRRLF